MRFTSEHPSQAWPFWLQLQLVDETSEAASRPKLRVELSASFLESTSGLQELNERLPTDGHVAVMWLAAVFQSAWEV